MIPYEVSDMCKKCIRKQIKVKGKFEVQCTPVPKALMDETKPFYPLDKVLDKDTYLEMSEKTKIDIQLQKNKLLWAKEFLGWGTYNVEREFNQFYQMEMLNCTAKLRAMRLGRRMGKTEVVTVDALHYALTNPGKNVLIIGPFQNLIDEIFDRISNLIDNENSAFQGQYERKRQPNEIRLANGSVIKGFTTGQNGDSIRGQSADRIYFDEAAYIPPTAFRSVMALLMDNKNVSITATSTPSAVETNFRKWCNEDPKWKDFHYASTLFPYFHEIEDTLRSTYTGDDFSLEVLAEFIEGSSKVFKSVDIDSASEEYLYINSRAELENPNDWIISIGCDWNEFRNGIQIVVMGFNKKNLSKPFKVLNRISIHKSEDGDIKNNIQIKGVRTIKELYRDFKADYVYVDQGHGSMQCEELSEYFHKIGVHGVFKAVDFASNYKYEDIYTGETKNKRSKVMMVYFLQKRFEMREIVISKVEEAEKGLMLHQLREYNIDRYDAKDQPIFTGMDHILDGMMLSVFAIVENLSTLFDRRTGNFVDSISRKGSDIEVFEEKIKDREQVKIKSDESVVNFNNNSQNDRVCSLRSKRRRKIRDDYELF